MSNASGCDWHNRLLAILDWIAYLVLIAGVGLGLGIALLAAALLFLPAAAAAEDGPRPGLLLKSAQDTVSAPMLDTEVHIQVSGMVARATVRQSFRNPSDEWREGVYVFPLPEDAAVDHLTMRSGKRVVAGEIREREAAGDRFNIIEFASHARALFPDAVAAGEGNRRRALQFVGALRANGGTEMAAALDLALNGRENPGRVRQVVFLTDGAVGNEEQLS